MNSLMQIFIQGCFQGSFLLSSAPSILWNTTEGKGSLSPKTVHSCACIYCHPCCGCSCLPLMNASLNQPISLWYFILLLIPSCVKYSITFPLYRHGNLYEELRHMKYKYKSWWIWGSFVFLVLALNDINITVKCAERRLPVSEKLKNLNEGALWE